MSTKPHPLLLYRKRHKLSVAAVARQLRVAPCTIWRIEAGRMDPSFGLMIEIAKATGGAVSPDRQAAWRGR